MLMPEGPDSSFQRREKQKIRRNAGPSIGSLTPEAQLHPVLLRKDLTGVGSSWEGEQSGQQKAAQRDWQDGEEMTVRAVGAVGTHESRLILHIHIPPPRHLQLPRGPCWCHMCTQAVQRCTSLECQHYIWGRKGLPGLLS